jgi:hypothetical protein
MIIGATVPGSAAELPLGLRDGFGETGQLDSRALVHQLWHHRPLTGGFVARLPSTVRTRYVESPLLANLVEISTPAREDVMLLPTAADHATQLGIRFVIVNRDTFVDGRLPRAALENAGFELVQSAGARELYVVRPAHRAQR